MGLLTLRKGVTLLELLMVTSLITTFLVIGVSVTNSVRTRLLETRCQQQLADIDAALGKYRENHRGQDPPHLAALVPDYLPPTAVICPLAQARAPRAVQQAQAIMQPTPFRYWASYFWFSRVGLDHLYHTGNAAVSYSGEMQRRGESVPIVACFDHREPWSLTQRNLVTPEMLANWYYPEAPLIVLRRSGRVDQSHYGGLHTNGTSADTEALLENL